jgi:hypothetical protein
MRRSLMVLAAALAVTAITAGVAQALPGESPANTRGVNGRIWSVVVVGNVVWVGGTFSGITNGDNTTVVKNSPRLAAFTLGGAPAAVSVPTLTGTEVRDLVNDGVNVFAAGNFTVEGTTKKHLIRFPGTGATNAQVVGFSGSGPLKSVEVANKVYAGGSKLYAWNKSGGAKLSTFKVSELTDAQGGHDPTNLYRDLDVEGSWLYAACQCSTSTTAGVTTPVNAMTRYDLSGNIDPSFSQNVIDSVGTGAYGLSVEPMGDAIFLGAGGSDFIARFGTDGNDVWKRDASGSVQGVMALGSDIIAGGHFTYLADEGSDAGGACGNSVSGLNPTGDCVLRNRLAAYTMDGGIHGWHPSVTGKYNGVWGLSASSAGLHVGGEFTRVHGVPQPYYALLP